MEKFSSHSTKAIICLIAILVFSTGAQAQYCTPAPTFGCALGDFANQFSMTNGSSPNINDPSLSCSSGSSGYEDRTAETCAVASPSMPTCVVTSNSTSSTGVSTTSMGGTSPTSTNENVEIWVDWDNSMTFTGSERIGGMSTLSNSPTTIPINIPSGIATGYYRMRMIVTSGGTDPNINPCMTLILSLNYFTGKAVDYTIYVGPTCTIPTVTLGTATCTSQIINWGAVSGAAGYEYVISTSSTAPTGSGTPLTATTYTATGLTGGITYYAYIRTNCGSGFSSWSSTQFTLGPSPIAGSTSVCTGATSQLSDAVSGGVWSSSNSTVATISNTGLVHGGAITGNTTITYSVGGCSTNISVTVGSLPAITGNTTICPGSTTQLSDATTGGFWGSSNTTVATIGQTTGLAHGGATAGTTTIIYGLSATCTASVTLTVAALPAITGGTTVCAGSTMTLNDATGGGVWSSSNTSFATVSASGVVYGVAVGSVTITYTLGGCNVTKAVTVGNSVSPITGSPTTFCVTSSTTLSDATAGGTWSSSNPAIVSVTGTVVVHGVSAGTATISYTLGGCSVTQVVNVDPNSAGTITGKDSICKGAGHAITLSDNATGGVWSSSNTSRATVDPVTGVVTATAYGASTVNINYAVTNTCGTYTTTYVVHLRTSGQCATGVDPVVASQLTELKVFPNPNDGTFTMNLSSDLNEGVHVVITDLLGEKVKEFTTVTNKLFDIKLNSAAGVYLLSASTDHGKYVTKVVVEK